MKKLLLRIGHTDVAVVLIGLAVLVRLWRIAQRPVSEGSWREVDGFVLARAFYKGEGHFLAPVTNWGGDNPVASEAAFVPWLSSVAYHLTGEAFWVGRAMVVVMSAVALWAFWMLGRRLVGPRAATVALAVVAFNPLWVYYGRTMMPDTPAYALGLLGLLALDEALRRGGGWRWLLSGVFLAVAVVAKLPVILLGVVALGLLQARLGWGILKNPWPWAVAVMVLVPSTLYLIHIDAIYNQTGNTFGILHGHDKTQPGLILTEAWWQEMGPRLMWQTIPKWFGPLVLVGLYALIRRLSYKGEGRRLAPVMPHERGARVVMVWLCLALFYLVVVAEGNLDMPHYQMPLVLPAALVIGLGVEAVLSLELPSRWVARLTQTIAVGFLAGGLIAGVFYFKSSMKPWPQRWDDGAKLQPLIPDRGPVLLLGGHTAHKGGGDYDPRPFFHIGARGWVLTEVGYSRVGLATYCAKGARYILINHPEPHLAGGSSEEFKTFLGSLEPLGETPSYTLYPMPPCDTLGAPQTFWIKAPGTDARPVEGGYVVNGL